MVAGPKPDFDAYRKRLNATITKGTVTIGQDRFWAMKEAEKEQNRRPDREYWSDESRPYGNPGPGKLARVVEATRTKCTFHWLRARLTYDPWARNTSPIACKIQVPRGVLFNADAYTPGDFKQFYDDPRTRAEYLKWAPVLLLAEEYKAGNREVGSRLT